MNRVVVTGMGAVSPFGLGVIRLMDALRAGRSAVVSMRSDWETQVEDLTCWVAAPLAESVDSRSIPRTLRRSMGRVAILAYLAAREALGQANLPESCLKSGRMGVTFASTMGSSGSLADFFAACQRGKIHGLSSGLFFQCMSHTCAANLAHAFGIAGRVLSPNAACSSSLQAIGSAFEMIQEGRQDVALCGGAEELHVVVSASFDLVQASSCRFNDRPSETPRPFDRHRDGTVCGEGGGALILENAQHARARGANILAEVVGYATGTDAAHLAQPHAEAITDCLERSLDSAGVSPDAIDYVNAHATGTLRGDQAEAEALRKVFGPDAVPVSSFKGHLGHTLGASGALELIACLAMQEEGYLIPTRNLEVPGEGCTGLDHVTTLRKGRSERFAKNSFAFGGVNAVLIMQRYRGDRSNSR